MYQARSNFDPKIPLAEPLGASTFEMGPESLTRVSFGNRSDLFILSRRIGRDRARPIPAEFRQKFLGKFSGLLCLDLSLDREIALAAQRQRFLSNQ